MKKLLKPEKYKGFSLLEIIISVSIFSVILLAVSSFFFSINMSSLKTNAQAEALENAKNALEAMTYEIKSAKSIYVPTTTAGQLSLETTRYLSYGESETFIDFFLCGTSICLKKEFQDSVAITSDSVNVTSLSFLQISTGFSPSVQINMTVNFPGSNSSSINLASAASIRNN